MPEDAHSGPATCLRTADEARRWLYNRINYERVSQRGEPAAENFKFRLDRMRELASELGFGDWLHWTEDCPPRKSVSGSSKPPRRPRKPVIVHVAGTKGKGSVATMIASILTAAGQRTGLYTSPHLESLNERFRIDGQPCSDDQLTGMVNRLRIATEAIENRNEITFFELTTAGAVDLFAVENCDAIVLEVGLGGRLDSTNVFSTDVTAITTIGLDHQNLLGRDHASIATEKAGIIKTGIPIFTSVRNADAATTIRRIAGERAAPLFSIDFEFDFDSWPQEPWGSRLKYRGSTCRILPDLEVNIPLEGEHQSVNASLAIATMLHVFEHYYQRLCGSELATIDAAAVRAAIEKGLASVRPPARLERLSLPGGQTIVLDAAHNIDSIDALCRVINDRAAENSVHMVFASSIDKQPAAMLRRLETVASKFYLTQFRENPRSIAAESLIAELPSASQLPFEVHTEATAALMSAIQSAAPDGWVVVCGSFFLAAELRPRIRELAGNEC